MIKPQTVLQSEQSLVVLVKEEPVLEPVPLAGVWLKGCSWGSGGDQGNDQTQIFSITETIINAIYRAGARSGEPLTETDGIYERSDHVE